jgi:hypothetical protein
MCNKNNSFNFSSRETPFLFRYKFTNVEKGKNFENFLVRGKIYFLQPNIVFGLRFGCSLHSSIYYPIIIWGWCSGDRLLPSNISVLSCPFFLPFANKNIRGQNTTKYSAQHILSFKLIEFKNLC